MINTDISEAGLNSNKRMQSNNTAILLSHTGYELSIEKSLCKKLAATKRVQHLSIVEKDGGTILTADAAMFELIREAAITYYKNYPQKFGQAKIETVTDSSKRNVVQHTIRVWLNEGNGYTLNIYLTTSRLMVNGKCAETFLDRDIHEVQKIVKTATFNDKSLDLGKLNNFIAEQVDKALTLRQGSPTKFKTNPSLQNGKSNKNQKNSPSQDENIKCKKCNKNCRKRSSFCSYGEHWVHYNCERLTDVEIREIETSKPDEQYTCKLCSTNSEYKSSLSIPSIGNSTADHAYDILLEEKESNDNSLESSENFCFVCEKNIDQRSSEICDSCNCTCHTKCGDIKDKLFMCIHCLGCVDQNNGPDTYIDCSTSSVAESDREVERFSRSEDGVLVGQKSQVNPELEHKNIERDNNVTVTNKPSSLMNSENTFVGNNKQLHKADGNKHANGPKLQSSDSNMAKEVKLSELRSKETKLKKWEEELKLKDKIHNEQNKERLKLETYCKKLEARNNELELMIKTLQNRCELKDSEPSKPDHRSLETEPKTMSSNSESSSIKYSLESKVRHVCDRVTDIVMKQIDVQLNKLEENMMQLNGNTTVKNTLSEERNEMSDSRENCKGNSEAGGVASSNVSEIFKNISNQSFITVPDEKLPAALSGPPLKYHKVPVRKSYVQISTQHMTQANISSFDENRSTRTVPRNRNQQTNRCKHGNKANSIQTANDPYVASTATRNRSMDKSQKHDTQQNNNTMENTEQGNDFLELDRTFIDLK